MILFATRRDNTIACRRWRLHQGEGEQCSLFPWNIMDPMSFHCQRNRGVPVPVALQWIYMFV